MIRILAFSGSLRRQSTNTALLGAAKLLAPDSAIVEIWDRAAELPHFTPDDETNVPVLVEELRSKIAECDGLIIACPEYMRGIPGSFKNVLDWLVGGETFIGIPTAVWNASPRASDAQRALGLVLETMSAVIVEEAGLTASLLGKAVTPQSICSDPLLASQVTASIDAFVRHLEVRRKQSMA